MVQLLETCELVPHHHIFSIMDEHFSAVLGTRAASEQADFIPSATFTGARHGFAFKSGPLGTGYYAESEGTATVRPSKRARDGEGDSAALDAEALLKAAEARAGQDVIDYDLDLPGLKNLLLGFEKKISKNQRLRVKFADEPEKFVESEMELDEEIKKLFAVAASPDLYPALVDLGAARSLLGLLAHDNTDVSLSVIGLLVELTDPETAEEAAPEMAALVNAILENQVLLGRDVFFCCE